ncbi:hypothetical protein [Rhizobium mongolense]|uniref:hypothetical protein n=1 Tax=Rhizobium mongolense TaxID=57676 RepID=UPI0034A37C68
MIARGASSIMMGLLIDAGINSHGKLSCCAYAIFASIIAMGVKRKSDMLSVTTEPQELNP